MSVGMPRENQSQEGHPLPAVDSTEGRRNERKVCKLPEEEHMKKAGQVPFISAIWGDQQQTLGGQGIRPG